MKKIFVAALVIALVVPIASQAKDMTGRLGLGYTSSDAPIGVRYWINERTGVDAAFGLQIDDLGTDTTGSSVSATSFWIEAGVPFQVYQGDRAHFMVRPGAQIGILDDRVFGTGDLDETWTVWDITLSLVAEVFFGENFAIEAAHGLALSLTSPPDVVSSDSFTDFRTFGRDLTTLGFRFYF